MVYATFVKHFALVIEEDRVTVGTPNGVKGAPSLIVMESRLEG